MCPACTVPSGKRTSSAPRKWAPTQATNQPRQTPKLAFCSGSPSKIRYRNPRSLLVLKKYPTLCPSRSRSATLLPCARPSVDPQRNGCKRVWAQPPRELAVYPANRNDPRQILAWGRRRHAVALQADEVQPSVQAVAACMPPSAVPLAGAATARDFPSGGLLFVTGRIEGAPELERGIRPFGIASDVLPYIPMQTKKPRFLMQDDGRFAGICPSLQGSLH